MNRDVEVLEIPEGNGLDSIRVYFEDVAEDKGFVTILCWSSAWTTFFGAHGCDSVKQFLAGCDTGYLMNRFGITPQLKQGAAQENYLRKIIKTVLTALAGGNDAS